MLYCALKYLWKMLIVSIFYWKNLNLTWPICCFSRETVQHTNERLLSLLSDSVKTYMGVEDTINRRLSQVVTSGDSGQGSGQGSGNGSRRSSGEEPGHGQRPDPVGRVHSPKPNRVHSPAPGRVNSPAPGGRVMSPAPGRVNSPAPGAPGRITSPAPRGGRLLKWSYFMFVSLFRGNVSLVLFMAIFFSKHKRFLTERHLSVFFMLTQHYVFRRKIEKFFQHMKIDF